MSDVTMNSPAPTEDPSVTQKLAAEVLGTFVMVFFGCGAAGDLSVV